MLLRTTALLLVCSLVPAATPPKPKKAKNVILLLADAAGIPTINAASLHGYNAPQKLFIQSWPYVGLSDTSPVGRWVSDSAAGMTAIVTGSKTKNGVISEGPEAGKEHGPALKTILEYAEEKGLSTGVLSNVTITDATPAACYAHVPRRNMWGDIFLQLFEPRFGDGVDVLFGPGRKAISAQLQQLGKDMDALGKEKGRPVYSNLSQIPQNAKRALVVADDGFELSDAAKKAVRMLSQNKKGFFLMIESDAHTNNAKLGLDRLVSFDRLIRELTEMVNSEETLFLFTADHSFDLRVVGNGGPEAPLLKGIEESGNTKSFRLAAMRMDNAHTGEEVLVTATGPGAERVKGFMPNTSMFRIMMDALGWQPSTK